jgi:hypothetical protein
VTKREAEVLVRAYGNVGADYSLSEMLDLLTQSTGSKIATKAGDIRWNGYEFELETLPW